MASTTQPPPIEAPVENELAADDNESTLGSDLGSDTTSIASVYKGYFENGRRYQSVRSTEYYQPTDGKQWESMEAGHMIFLIMDSQRRNVLFQSPISPKAQHILDLGTGHGDWALDVADKFPNITVHGVDLMAPPQPWTAPNCVFEVDDVSKEWTWEHKFDLVHIRNMLGAFSDSDWNILYKRIYDNLEPGGWIEQLELDVGLYCDDGTLPKDSILNYKDYWHAVSKGADRSMDTQSTMKGKIEQTGFTNVHKQDYKVPCGSWPKLQVYKDAGRASKEQFLKGIEGWCLYLLTRHGLPKPYSVEEAHTYIAKVREEINQGYHIYHKYMRVWAQKPFEKETKA